MGHDPFTIDLFGNSVLVSGFDLGATGYAVISNLPWISILVHRRRRRTVHKERDAKLQMRTKIDFRLQGSRASVRPGAPARVTTSQPSSWQTKSNVTACRHDQTSRHV